MTASEPGPADGTARPGTSGSRTATFRTAAFRPAPARAAGSRERRSRAGRFRAGRPAAGFGSASVPRHLARGALGFGALAGGLALLPAVGPVSLLLVPVGVVALRGCPMCWTLGLVETVSAGRLRRSCADGSCGLERAGAAAPPPGEKRAGV
ncbi:hypothetical protein AB0M23_02145 [Streptomyces sp. NPDC052077]|uniref:hypothetical protein n=1 Tax=Streptomyces sp. NPDC052077 TaxID=3154757 RepID=UPI0034386934